jgi:hypothetical protein
MTLATYRVVTRQGEEFFCVVAALSPAQIAMGLNHQCKPGDRVDTVALVQMLDEVALHEGPWSSRIDSPLV